MVNLAKFVEEEGNVTPATWGPIAVLLSPPGTPWVSNCPPGHTYGQQKNMPQTSHLVVPCTWGSPPTGTLPAPDPSSVYTWVHPALLAWVFQSHSMSTRPLDNLHHQTIHGAPGRQCNQALDSPAGIQPPQTLTTKTLGQDHILFVTFEKQYE